MSLVDNNVSLATGNNVAYSFTMACADSLLAHLDVTTDCRACSTHSSNFLADDEIQLTADLNQSCSNVEEITSIQKGTGLNRETCTVSPSLETNQKCLPADHLESNDFSFLDKEGLVLTENISDLCVPFIDDTVTEEDELDALLSVERRDCLIELTSGDGCPGIGSTVVTTTTTSEIVSLSTVQSSQSEYDIVGVACTTLVTVATTTTDHTVVTFALSIHSIMSSIESSQVHTAVLPDERVTSTTDYNCSSPTNEKMIFTTPASNPPSDVTGHWALPMKDCNVAPNGALAPDGALYSAGYATNDESNADNIAGPDGRTVNCSSVNNVVDLVVGRTVSSRMKRVPPPPPPRKTNCGHPPYSTESMLYENLERYSKHPRELSGTASTSLTFATANQRPKSFVGESPYYRRAQFEDPASADFKQRPKSELIATCESSSPVSNGNGRGKALCVSGIAKLF